MNRNSLTRLTCALILLAHLCAAQDKPLIPVTCRQTSDALITPRPSAQDADEKTRLARADRSIITMDEPPNLGIARYRIADYADRTDSSRCYWADLDAQTRRAQAELKRLVDSSKPGEQLALVLDIDDTSLSSYCEEKREDFGYIRSMYEAWIASPDASIPIPGTLALFKQALAANVSVFFITGRNGAKHTSNDQTEATARNLKAAGYDGWAGLILRDESELKMDTTLYKSTERAKLIKQGFRIILSVGDQWSDLNDPPKTGDNAKRPTSRAAVSVKLPNPFYYLP